MAAHERRRVREAPIVERSEQEPAEAERRTATRRARSVLEFGAGARTAHVVATSAADGDLAIAAPPSELAARRRAVVDLPWTWLRQVHGATVVRVDRPGEGAGAEADAMVTAIRGAALAVQVADCAPVALVGSAGVVGIAHVGWRGLVAGTIAATVGKMNGGDLRAVIGPCIHGECYEFGGDDLALAEKAAGARVRSRTSWGTPSLDLVAGVEDQLRACAVEVVASPWDECTACTPGYWSYRARGDAQRQAMVVWMT